MIALWKGKKHIYFGVIRSKVKVIVTINIISYRLIIYIDGHILWCTHFLLLLICFARNGLLNTSHISDFDLRFNIAIKNPFTQNQSTIVHYIYERL
jgi:hypothetical protein